MIRRTHRYLASAEEAFHEVRRHLPHLTKIAALRVGPPDGLGLDTRGVVGSALSQGRSCPIGARLDGSLAGQWLDGRSEYPFDKLWPVLELGRVWCDWGCHRGWLTRLFRGNWRGLRLGGAR